MEWFSFPLELFAYIIVDLDVASIVQLEKVCKSWQENLKNQLIWKVNSSKNSAIVNSVSYLHRTHISLFNAIICNF